MSRRILVTGSRTWSDGHIVHAALLEHCEPRDVIVHGACPTGVDAMADFYWGAAGGKVERWAADWEGAGKVAGYARNHMMVATGPDLCLAFIRNNSPGATNCVDRALKAGIPAIVYRRDEYAAVA